MALQTEAGNAEADAYIDVPGLDEYAENFGHDLSGHEDGAKEAAIRRATLWVDGRGRGEFWPGLRKEAAQALEWPRRGATYIDGTAIDEATIPRPVALSTAEAAIFDLTNPGILHADITRSESVRKTMAGPAGVSEEFTTRSLDVMRVMLTAVEDLLAPILRTDKKDDFLMMAIGGNGDD